MDDMSPRTGTSETVIVRLREYAASIDPSLFLGARGAPGEMLTLYSELSGFGSPDALPTSYRIFLQSMGMDDGGLLKIFGLQARLPLVIKLYQDCVRSEPDSLNPQLPIVATYIIGDQISFDRTTQAPEPQVVESSDGELVRPLSQSWEHLLMQAAMLHVEVRRLAHGRSFSTSPDGAAGALPYDADGQQSAAAAIDSFAAKLGLTIAWPSDSRHRIAAGGEVSLFAEIDPGNAALVRLFSSDEALLRRLTDELALALGATSSGRLVLVDGALQRTSS